MLASYAIKRFRKRELNSFEYMKKLSRETLLQMVDELDPNPDFVSAKPMWKHQLVAFLVGVYVPQALLFLDMGTGKTRVTLELIAYLKKCGDLTSAIVVVPNDVAIESWVMQVEEHRPDLTCVPMYGNSQERLRLLELEADLFVVSYPALIWMCSDLRVKRSRKRKKTSKGGDKKALVVSRAKVNKVSARFNFMCLDETTEIMNQKSMSFRVCRRISAGYRYRFGLAGIPVGRDPEALWSQFNYCDHGETLGENIGVFRSAFCSRKTNYWSGYYDYKFDKKWTKLLNRIIQNRSITYGEEECHDLPKRVAQKIYVPFTDDMRAYYNKIVEKFKEGKGDLRVVRGTFHHMRQLASGFIGLVDDETGARVQLEFPENPKLEALLQKIREIPPKRKFLVYHEYIWTGDRISAMLKQAGIKHGRLRGGQKDQPAVLRKFLEDEEMHCLVINNNCGSFVLNLQVANYEIFVESSVSPIVRRQAEKRIRRGGQKRRCFIIDLVMRNNSADENIQSYLREGRNLERELLRGKAKLRVRRV